MSLALEEAQKAYEIGEVPIGAVIVKDNLVIARAHNKRETDRMSTAHAEIRAIEEACRKLGGWRLIGCTMYVTLEPCLMCAGALINSRIDKLVYASSDQKAGAVDSLYSVLNDFRLNHQVEVVSGILDEESSGLLKRFFRDLREEKKTGKQD